jgi:glycosyltransferase involved in cell wall biosynthesis
VRESSSIASAQSQTKQPLVSVIVPTFNRPEMLMETLASIDAQAYGPIEILVINDGGSDVEPLLGKLNHHRKIIHLKHDTNRGLPAARNTGIKAASGEYIAYVDDDDVYYPDHIETLVSFLVNSSSKVAYTDAYQADEVRGGTFLNNLTSLQGGMLLFLLSRIAPGSGLQFARRSIRAFGPCFDQPFLKLAKSNVDPFLRAGGKYLIVERKSTYSIDFDRDTLLVTNFVPVLCVMHHRSCVDEAGLFDETLTSHEDWDLWIRIAEAHNFAHIKKITCEYSQRADGSNMSSYRRADFRRTMKIIHERYRHLVGNANVIEAQNAYLGNLSRSQVEASKASE